jgi:hypothetical protein
MVAKKRKLALASRVSTFNILKNMENIRCCCLKTHRKFCCTRFQNIFLPLWFCGRGAVALVGYQKWCLYLSKFADTPKYENARSKLNGRYDDESINNGMLMLTQLGWLYMLYFSCDIWNIENEVRHKLPTWQSVILKQNSWTQENICTSGAYVHKQTSKVISFC